MALRGMCQSAGLRTCKNRDLEGLFGVCLFSKQIFFFDEPVDLQPMIQAALAAGIVGVGPGLLVSVGMMN